MFVLRAVVLLLGSSIVVLVMAALALTQLLGICLVLGGSLRAVAEELLRHLNTEGPEEHWHPGE